MPTNMNSITVNNRSEKKSQKPVYAGEFYNQAQDMPSEDGMSNQQAGQGLGNQSGQSNRPSTEISGYRNSEMAINAAKNQIVTEEFGGQQFDQTKKDHPGYAPRGDLKSAEPGGTEQMDQTSRIDRR